MTDAAVAAARGAGVLALGTPRRHGGLEADLTTRVRVLAELGRGCPSTAWITATTAEAKIAVRAALPEAAAAEVFADPDAVMCASARPGRAEQIPGGLRFSGRWGFASGCEHAAWALLVALLDGRPVAALVPTDRLSIDRDWHVAGLAGTGSHTLVGENVEVPDSHVLDISRMSGAGSDVATALGLFATLLGAARGGCDVVAAAIEGRPSPSAAYPGLAHVPGAQQSFAEAVHLIDTAEQRMLRIAEAVDAVAAGEQIPALDRARLRMDVLAAIRECRRAFDDLLDLHGSAGFQAANPLQRFWRDFSIGSRHVQFASHAITQEYGALLLGVEQIPSGPR